MLVYIVVCSSWSSLIGCHEEVRAGLRLFRRSAPVSRGKRGRLRGERRRRSITQPHASLGSTEEAETDCHGDVWIAGQLNFFLSLPPSPGVA